MITIILHKENDEIEVLYPGDDPPHIVVVNEKEEWTNSPSIFGNSDESEQTEQIMAYRNEGYEDRNP